MPPKKKLGASGQVGSAKTYNMMAAVMCVFGTQSFELFGRQINLGNYPSRNRFEYNLFPLSLVRFTISFIQKM